MWTWKADVLMLNEKTTLCMMALCCYSPRAQMRSTQAKHSPKKILFQSLMHRISLLMRAMLCPERKRIILWAHSENLSEHRTTVTALLLLKPSHVCFLCGCCWVEPVVTVSGDVIDFYPHLQWLALVCVRKPFSFIQLSFGCMTHLYHKALFICALIFFFLCASVDPFMSVKTFLFACSDTFVLQRRVAFIGN